MRLVLHAVLVKIVQVVRCVPIICRVRSGVVSTCIPLLVPMARVALMAIAHPVIPLVSVVVAKIHLRSATVIVRPSHVLVIAIATAVLVSTDIVIPLTKRLQDRVIVSTANRKKPVNRFPVVG